MCGLCAEEQRLFKETKAYMQHMITTPGYLNVSFSVNANTGSCGEFRICDYTSGNTKQDALNCARQEPLFDETGSKTMFHFEADKVAAEVRLTIPKKVNCSTCVLQLKYLAGL